MFDKKNFSWDSWYLTTIHWVENADSIDRIANILSALNQLEHMVIFPVHPRIKGMVSQLKNKEKYDNMCFIEPLGYLDMLFFLKNAVKPVTDSGGLQKEAYILKTNTVTIREQTEWVETLKNGHNCLASPEVEDLLKKINGDNVEFAENEDLYYGDEIVADKIISLI